MTFSTVQHVPPLVPEQDAVLFPGLIRDRPFAARLPSPLDPPRPSGVTVLTDCTLISVDNFKLDGPPDIVFS